MSTRANNKVKRKRQGATMVEFAVVAIPMFLLIFGLIEFSRVAMMDGIAEDACYEACRDVIVPGAVIAEGVAEGQNILGLIGTQGATVDIVPRDMDNNIQTEIDEDTATVTVNVSVPMAQNLLFLNRWTGGVTLEKTCAMTTERFAGFFDGTGS